MNANNAGAYGIGLAFWENGVLLGILPLISVIATYVLLSTGGSTASLVYNSISTANPGLFNQVNVALPTILFGILERVSSIIMHYSWGLLCVVAAVYKKRRYLFIALPMGLVDFLVPFSSSMPLYIFESLVFLIAVISLAAARLSTRNLKTITIATS